jgi:CRISPR-associated endoribonuclease Cas6/Csy4 subtype I-F
MIYVVEFSFSENSDEPLLERDRRVSKLVTLIHRAARGREFAIGFPDYQSGTRPTLGQRLELFSFTGSNVLIEILRDSRLASFIIDWCKISPVRSITPSEVDKWTIFKKSQIANKRSLSHYRRAERRLREGKRTLDRPLVQNGTAQERAQMIPRLFHYSLSVDRETPFRIDQVPSTGAGKPTFDSFGLALSGSCGIPVLT